MKESTTNGFERVLDARLVLSVIAAGMVLVVLLVFKLCILRLLRGLRKQGSLS